MNRSIPVVATTASMALFLTFASALPAAAQNLLTNGSFETGNFTGVNPGNDAGSTQLFIGATNINSWTVVNAELAWLQNGNPYSMVASNQSRFLDLTGYHDASPYGGLTQTIATAPGAVYHLSFDIGAFAGFTNGITATAGTALTQTLTFSASAGGPTFQYGTVGFDFTANNANTVISLVGQSSGNGNSIGLDNASVTLIRAAPGAAPEPGSVALVACCALPLLGIATRRRCRRIAAAD